MEAVLWIVLAIALAIAEAFTATLFVAMFAAGALAAAGAAALGAPVLVQAIVFAVVSALSIGAIRPLIVRRQNSALEGGESSFGLAALEGAQATVLEQVDADRGMIKIDGELWQARSFDGTETYQPGDHVRVVKVRGATALVWRDDLPHL
ncbi:NfeD family protein [Krasilnikovia cinnamomea]|uniref:NfeD family protein n=1 Tax=Krasilnikovia cinnamomea TaxID=349313 RepID=UPI00102ACB73|nr:NfeD family protein [Krasilnikovia cinnamomea]